VREFSDRVYVIYRGSMTEHGTTAQLFRDPRHPYTRALLSAVPRIVGGGLPRIPERSPDFEQPLVVHPGCGEPGERQAA
jgi:peptide/nickel transport system ATP-binding protein